MVIDGDEMKAYILSVKKQISRSVRKIQNKKIDEQTMKTLLLIIAFFVSKDTMLFGTINDFLLKLSQIIMIISTVLVFAYIKTRKIEMQRETIWTLCVYVLLIAMSCILNADYRLGYVYVIVILTMCSFLLTIIKPEDIFAFYYKAMTMVSAFSVVAFALQKMIPQITTLFPTLYNVSGIRFRFLLFTNLDDTTGTFLRNWGPFREPGVFQAFVAISLIYGLFKKKNTSFTSVLFHLLAIVTTFSTTGYIILGLVLVATVAQKRETMLNPQLYKKCIIVSCIGALYLMLFTDVLLSTGETSYASVFGKLTDGINGASMGSRIASIIVNIRIFLERPLIGAGLSYVDMRFSQICLEMYGSQHYHNTNTLFILLTAFGAVFMVIAAFKIWRYIDDFFEGGRISKLLLFVAYLCMLMGENMMYSVVVMLPLLYVSKRETQCINRGMNRLKGMQQRLRKLQG